MIGVAIGAFVSMKLSGAKRAPISPIWQRALGSPSPTKRYAVAFTGGFMLLVGARIADGCTSGHGLSGMAQLAVGPRSQSPPCSPEASPPQCAAAPDLKKETAMSVTFAVVVGLAMGIVFGFALEKSRVFEPGVIVGQMQCETSSCSRCSSPRSQPVRSCSRCSTASAT